jgi:hypothetical protein
VSPRYRPAGCSTPLTCPAALSSFLPNRNSFGIRTYAKRVSNSFRTLRLRAVLARRIRTYEKTPRGEGLPGRCTAGSLTILLPALSIGCQLSAVSYPLSPFPATLTNPLQLTENSTTLSPVFATLTSHVKPKSFICHSYKKQGGWGYPLASPYLFTSLFHYFFPYTRSAMLPSILWKKKSPPTRTSATAPVDASSSGPGGWPCPVNAHRKPSITPAIGFSP